MEENSDPSNLFSNSHVELIDIHCSISDPIVVNVKDWDSVLVVLNEMNRKKKKNKLGQSKNIVYCRCFFIANTNIYSHSFEKNSYFSTLLFIWLHTIMSRF